MADNINVTPGSGASIAADDIGGGLLVQRVKVTHGVDGTASDANATTPLPVREPAQAAPLTHGGGTSGTASATLITANASRQYIEVSNGGSSGIWLRFGATAAVAGQGSYLPAKSSNSWPYSGEVRYILEASGSAGPVGYVEW